MTINLIQSANLTSDITTKIQYNVDLLGSTILTPITLQNNILKIDNIEYNILQKYTSIQDVNSTYVSIIIYNKDIPTYYKYNSTYVCDGTLKPIALTKDNANIHKYYIIAQFDSIIGDNVYFIKPITFNNTKSTSNNFYINITSTPTQPPVYSIDTTNTIFIKNKSLLNEIIINNNYYIYTLSDKNKIIYFNSPIYAGLINNTNNMSIAFPATLMINLSNSIILDIPHNSTNSVILSSVIDTINPNNSKIISSGKNIIEKAPKIQLFNTTGNNDIYIECGDSIPTTTTGTIGSSILNNQPKYEYSKLITLFVIVVIVLMLLGHLIYNIDKPNTSVTKTLELVTLFIFMFFPFLIFN